MSFLDMYMYCPIIYACFSSIINLWCCTRTSPCRNRLTNISVGTKLWCFCLWRSYLSPIFRYILTSFYTKYDRVHFVVNTVSLLTVLIPKLPQLHGVRIFGINKYWQGGRGHLLPKVPMDCWEHKEYQASSDLDLWLSGSWLCWAAL